MARCTDRTTDNLDALLSEDVFDTRQLIELIDHPQGEASRLDDPDDHEELSRAYRLLAEVEPYCDDYRYGASVIADSYFQDYAQELADDCGMVDGAAGWPLRHIDWAAAAEELKQDYTGGVRGPHLVGALMSLTDLYAPYEFANGDDGPGCGTNGHSSSCLCDLHVSDDEINAPTILNGWHRKATQVAGVPTNGAQFERWASELLGLQEAVQERLRSMDETKLSDARSSLIMRTTDGEAKGRHRHRTELLQVLAQGLDLVSAADHLGITTAEAVRSLTRQDSTPVPAYLEAERLLRAGARSLGEVAKATGLSRFVIRNLAEAIGVQTMAKAQRAAGGGITYTAEQYAEVVRLREQGLSFGAIEKATGVGKTAAFRIHRKLSKASA